MNAIAFAGPGLCAHRSRTNVPGVGIAEVDIKGRKQLHYTAHCGQVTKKFNIKRLGKSTAWRAALTVRVQYERSRS